MWNIKEGDTKIRKGRKDQSTNTQDAVWASRLTTPPVLHPFREAPITAPCSPQRASSKSLPRQHTIRWAWGKTSGPQYCSGGVLCGGLAEGARVGSQGAVGDPQGSGVLLGAAGGLGGRGELSGAVGVPRASGHAPHSDSLHSFPRATWSL